MEDIPNIRWVGYDEIPPPYEQDSWRYVTYIRGTVDQITSLRMALEAEFGTSVSTKPPVDGDVFMVTCPKGKEAYAFIQFVKYYVGGGRVGAV